jgi:hypothetical protein
VRLLRCEAPIHTRTEPIALPAPSLRLPPERPYIRQPSSEALANQDRELYLDHV